MKEMEIIEYYASEDQDHWLNEIKSSDWGAGHFLYELLRDNRLKELCGESTKVLLLTDGDVLVSFCTYAEQDDIRETSLTPWVGFVYTFPEYRGKRYMGKLLERAYTLAKDDGYEYIYISTGETGLYEKYGYSFWKMMKDMHGEDSRVYRKNISSDMTVGCDNGLINIRVGAIIMKDGKILMVGNERSDYLYSVGGRIKFGETAEEAVIREVLEETGVRMEIDRLGFVHENYFYGDAPSNLGKLIYEISFFFYMQVPDGFFPFFSSFTEDESKEHLRWVAVDDTITMYPDFFKTELSHPDYSVKHFVTDERKSK